MIPEAAKLLVVFLKTAVMLSLQQIRPGGSIISLKCLSRQQHLSARIQAVRIHVCNTAELAH